MATTSHANYPRCRKHKLLRKAPGRDNLFFPIVVASSALHDYLGGAKYQEFIQYLRGHGGSMAHPTIGFDPEIVEAWLKQR